MINKAYGKLNGIRLMSLNFKSIIQKLLIKYLINKGLSKNDTNLSQLSHDLKNHLVAIRAVCSKIEKQRKTGAYSDLDKNLASIDGIVTDTFLKLEMYNVLSKPIGPSVSFSGQFSILECIQEAIQTYPFSSKRFAAWIQILTLGVDFSIHGDPYLMKHVFYCLIKNSVDAIYGNGEGEGKIIIDKNEMIRSVRFELPAPTSASSLFALGCSKSPGKGFLFIQQVMSCLGGRAILGSASNDCIATVTLLY